MVSNCKVRSHIYIIMYIDHGFKDVGLQTPPCLQLFLKCYNKTTQTNTINSIVKVYLNNHLILSQAMQKFPNKP